MSTPPDHAWIRPVPNVLTFLRLALAGVLPFVPQSWWLPVILGAGVSDALDGWIARRFRATSELGRLLDGVADKAITLSAVLTLTLAGTMRPWQGPLVLTRDIVVAALAVGLAARHAWSGFRHMRVRWAGKLTTLLAFGWLATLLLPAPEGLRMGAFVLAAGATSCKPCG
jgi:phosphatidylglycerophosphate synthase